jgi:heat shock protein HslJ
VETVTDTTKTTGRGRRLAPAALALLTGLGAMACTDPGGPGGPGSTTAPTRPTTTTTAPRPGLCHAGAFDTATLERPTPPPGGGAGAPTILRVTGTLPSMSQTVSLVPVTYVQQPEFWQIDVVVCDPPGAGLPATKPFSISLDVTSTLGTEGVVVVGSNQSVKLPLDGPAPGRPTVVGNWSVTGVSGGITGGVIPLVPGTSISLNFDRAGKINGKACNSYFGSYVQDGANLSISGVGSTKMACTTPEGVMAQESRYLQSLGSVATAKVSGNELSLLDKSGKEIVTARRGMVVGPR